MVDFGLSNRLTSGDFWPFHEFRELFEWCHLSWFLSTQFLNFFTEMLSKTLILGRKLNDFFCCDWWLFVKYHSSNCRGLLGSAQCNTFRGLEIWKSKVGCNTSFLKQSWFSRCTENELAYIPLSFRTSVTVNVIKCPSGEVLKKVDTIVSDSILDTSTSNFLRLFVSNDHS